MTVPTSGTADEAVTGPLMPLDAMSAVAVITDASVVARAPGRNDITEAVAVVVDVAGLAGGAYPEGRSEAEGAAGDGRGEHREAAAAEPLLLGTTRTLQPLSPEQGSDDQNKYVSPAETTERLDRQEARYRLRASLRVVTEHKRLKTCGLPLGVSDVVVKVRDQVHHYSGISTCGSGWACPVCAAKIRFGRADEVSRAIVNAIERNMGALFVTRTIPHTSEEELKLTLGLLAEGRRWVSNQKSVKKARARAGYFGGIAAKEITYGLNGWHPHTHDVEVFSGSVTDISQTELTDLYFDFLNKFYTRSGHRPILPGIGVKVDVVTRDADALGNYVAKLQEGGSLSNEMTRADLKKGKHGSMMPFDIAAEFFNTGDCDLMDLWHEYEKETKGKSIIRFTKGLRALLLPDEEELTDDELAAKEVGGIDVVRFENWLYRAIVKYPGLEAKILAALDTEGFAAMVRLLTAYHLDTSGVHRVEAD